MLPNTRQHFIDWIRVLAFFLLILFHCAMPFVNHGWEVKNADTSEGLTRVIWWLHQWRLPLLFFVSGVGIHYSLRKRSVWRFAGERVVRLFIPLLFAMFFTIPMQVYIEKLQKGLIGGSYLAFYPTVWDMVPYPEGSLSWSHMWFVVYLFVFCMLLLPVFGLFRWKPAAILRQKLAQLFSRPWSMLLPVALFFYYYHALYLEYPEQQSLLDDWFLFVSSATYLLLGYLFAGSAPFWQNSERYRYYWLSISLACMVYLFAEYWWNMDLPKKQDARLYIFGLFNSLHVWSILLACAGFAKRHLNFSNSFLQWANEAVYPFYIMHQTVIVVAGYYVVQWPMGIAGKLILLVLLSMTTLFLLYHFIIKRFLLTRIIYGMKVGKRNKAD